MATLVTRSGKGSPLTHAEVDANFTNLNTDKLELSGGTMTGNLSFGDNDKAIFGAGSDLQIYHDGSDSYIDDTGTGDLIVRGNVAVKIAKYTGEAMITANADADVKLMYNNSPKLATTSTGVDITGTLTSDGLNLDGHIQGEDGQNLQVSAGEGNGDKLDLRAGDAVRIWVDGVSTYQKAAEFADNGDISFYEDTGTTAKFFWDASAERLGVGTSSPSRALHVSGGTSDTALRLESSDENVFMQFSDGNTTFEPHIGAKTNDLVFLRGASGFPEVMRIDSSGNVGIGTTNPIADLSIVDSSTSSGIEIQPEVTTDTNRITNYDRVESAYKKFRLDASEQQFYISGTEAMRIDSSGNVGIGTASPSLNASYDRVLHIHSPLGSLVKLTDNTSGSGASDGTDLLHYGDSSYLVNREAGSIILGTSGTERMRIDSSGNLLVGTTNVNNNAEDGIRVKADGTLQVRSDNSGFVAILNRSNASDGDILTFAKSNTTVGSIGTGSNGLYIVGDTTSSNAAGLAFVDGSPDRIIPCSGTGASLDNNTDLGESGTRFDDIYATNGTIQTSDQNEKQDIAELSDAEQRVAVAAKGLLRKFRWRDAVEEKGDEARTHFGIIAQDLQAAFAAEGLDAGDYAMFIHTTWTDEETGEEKSRMGVRYSELLAFIIAAIQEKTLWQSNTHGQYQ